MLSLGRFGIIARIFGQLSFLPRPPIVLKHLRECKRHLFAGKGQVSRCRSCRISTISNVFTPMFGVFTLVFTFLSIFDSFFRTFSLYFGSVYLHILKFPALIVVWVILLAVWTVIASMMQLFFSPPLWRFCPVSFSPFRLALSASVG